MDLRSEKQVFRTYKNMCKIIPMMTKVMYNQKMKNSQDLKPFDISNIA